MKWSFQRLSLNTRTALVVVAVVVGLLGLTVVNALQSRAKQMDALQNLLRSHVESAVAVVQGFHDRAQNGGISEVDAEKQALAELHNMRWSNGSGYFFVFADDYTLLMHPVLPKLVGTNVGEVKDKNGTLIYQNIRNIDAKDGGGVTYYDWPKPPSMKVVGKMAYSQLFKPWNIHIGMEAYFDDIDAQFHRDLMLDLLWAGIVVVLVIALVWLSMNSIRRSIGG